MSRGFSKKRLFGSFDTIHLGHLENLLLQAGIRVEKRNQFAVGGFGELPVMDVMPELWVDDDAYAEAVEILRRANDVQQEPAAAWICPQCGESIEGQFCQCWNCGYWPEEKA